MAGIGAPCGGQPAWLTDPVGRWAVLGRPLRALPRWGAGLVLLLTAALLAWSSVSVTAFRAEQLLDQSERRAARDTRFGDVDLYLAINERVRTGEGYYQAATAEHRAHEYPTSPFVTVRTPIAAWGDSLFGQQGWRAIAIAALLANIFAWFAALRRRCSIAESAGAALLILAGGVGVLFEFVGVVHELLAGLFLSLAVALYRPERWWPCGIAAAAAIAIRELAVPFVLLWAAFAMAQRRWRELGGVLALLALFTVAMLLHAQGVAAARLPGDPVSPGWSGLHGLPIVLNSLARLSFLLVLPFGVAGPLALLPILGWIGLGGRLGLFASLWFIGIAAAIALFARHNNFYWVFLLLPAYFAGFALVPRAVWDLLRASISKS